MIGLAIALGLLILYFTTAIEYTKAFGQSVTISLESIQSTDQEAAAEKIKEQWLATLNRLLEESQPSS